MLNTAGSGYLTQEESSEIWQCVAEHGMIDSYVDITTAFTPAKADFTFTLPEKYTGLDDAVIGRIERFISRDFVKNGRDRQKVTYNKRVELNTDFQALWNKISQKTRYSVEFKTAELVTLAAEKVNTMAEIKSVQIEITKRERAIKESCLEGGKISSHLPNAQFRMKSIVS